jgi:flagellar biosynthesis anti-sigma factor FlgM
MRIDGFQNIPAVLQMLKAGRVSHSNASAEATNDSSSVNLSSFGSILQSVQRDAAAKIKAREAQVNAIADAVSNGSLKMDLERLAAKMVDLQIIDFKG